MAKERKGSLPSEDEGGGEEERHRHKRSKRRREESGDGDNSDSRDDEEPVSRKKRRRGEHRGSRRGSKRSRGSCSESEGDGDSSASASHSDSSSEDSSEASYSEGSEEEVRRRRRRKRRRKEREHEKERRRKEKERRMRKEREKKKKKEKRKERKEKKEKDLGKKGAVTNSWGKYGVIRETDMWNKRPEFTAWLAEVKKVNLESLANWEEKQMFKEFMEDHNTATFPSKKYYDLDAYHRRMMVKEMKKGHKKVREVERTIFNDEELRRQELMIERERQKEQEVETLKRSMQSGMAQAMKEQAQLKEEMAYQYKLGNLEAAAAIQRRLDPDVAL